MLSKREDEKEKNEVEEGKEVREEKKVENKEEKVGPAVKDRLMGESATKLPPPRVFRLLLRSPLSWVKD